MITVILTGLFVVIILFGFILEVRLQHRRKVQWENISKLSSSLPLQIKKINNGLSRLDRTVQRANDLISGRQDSIKGKLLDAESITSTLEVRESDSRSVAWAYEVFAEELRKNYYKSFDDLLIDVSTVRKCPEFARDHWITRKGRVNALIGAFKPDIELGKFGSATTFAQICLKIHGDVLFSSSVLEPEKSRFGSVENWNTIKSQQLQGLVTIES